MNSRSRNLRVKSTSSIRSGTSSVHEPLAGLREDFCGTAAVSIEWVKRRGDNHATGVDLDRPTLDWTLGRMDGLLDENQKSKKINLIEGDVLSTKTDAVDTLLATSTNSTSSSKSRDQLRNYFEIVRDGLVDDGLFILVMRK